MNPTDLPRLDYQLAIVQVFRELGLRVRLSLTRAEAATLSVDDVEALKELGAGPRLLDDVRALGLLGSDEILEVDFETQSVTVMPD